MPEHRRLEPGPVGLGVLPRDEAVERNDRADHVGALARENEGETPAHAEADHARLVARDRVEAEQMVDRTTHVLGRLVDVQGHHELAGLVGLGRRGPVVQVRRQGGETLGREAVGTRR